ncbi:MAG: aldo/keto reductase [Acidobacteriota bacterium]
MVERIVLRPGYSISRLISGGWQLSEGHRPDPPDADRLVDDLERLVDAGFTTFDGADIYTGVETLFGRLIARLRRQGRRDAIQVHTKCVPDLDLLPTLTRADLERTVERSLRRIRVERLDLVQFHWWDFAVDGWLDAFGHLDDLRRAGKIRHLAVTNFDTARLKTLLDAGFDVAAHQLQFSLLDRRPHRSMVELCRDRDVHLLAYGTLAGGFLTRRWLDAPDPDGPLANRSLVKYRLIIDEAGGWGRFQGLLRGLAALGAERGASIANLATRFALERPGVAAAVVGVSGARRLEDNLRVFETAAGGDELEALAAQLDVPPGDVYALEREPGGRHAVIMRTDLNDR